MSVIVRIKICGIQSLKEAHWSVEAGADALGFIFVPSSKRYIEPKRVQAITSELPPFVKKVGVFAEESPAKVAEIVNLCNLDSIQLHGGEDLELYREIPATKIKVISFSTQITGEVPFCKHLPLPKQKLSPRSLHAILLDSTHQGQIGGTGIPLPWQDPQFQDDLQMVKDTGYPVILAGGLNPENIHDALEHTQPYGVDVSSGVEREGRKDRELIRKFISRIKNL